MQGGSPLAGRAVAGAELKFSGFNWEASSQYLEHLQRVDLTAAVDQAAALTKVRRKWYKKNVDQDLPLQPTRAPAAQAEAPRPNSPAAASAMLQGAPPAATH